MIKQLVAELHAASAVEGLALQSINPSWFESWLLNRRAVKREIALAAAEAKIKAFAKAIAIVKGRK